jgi:hypothetical protein
MFQTSILITFTSIALTASAAPIATISSGSLSAPPGGQLDLILMPSSIPFQPGEISLPPVPVSPALEGHCDIQFEHPGI